MGINRETTMTINTKKQVCSENTFELLANFRKQKAFTQ